MGIIIPKNSTRGTSDFGDNIAVLPPSDGLSDSAMDSSSSAPMDRPAGGPDAYVLNRADYPNRELPKVGGMRDARFQVVFKQSVLDQIHKHGKTSMEAEVCGVLVGNVYSDRLAPWAYVEHCIAGDTAVGKQTQVTFTSETWTKIHETLEKDYPGMKILGWYHTHPGFGIFLSGMDLFIQDNFFNQPWNIATVYDPHSGDEGTFVWRGGKSMQEPVLVENDTGVDPKAAAKAVGIADLEKRIAKLERRLDFILTGFLFLVLLALISPLLIFAISPDAIKKNPIFQHLNNTTQPGDKTAKPPAAKDSNGLDKAPAPGATAAPGDPLNDDVTPTSGKTLTPKQSPKH